MNTRSKEIRQTRQKTKLRERKHYVSNSGNTLKKLYSPKNKCNKSKTLKLLKSKCNKLQKSSSKNILISNKNNMSSEMNTPCIIKISTVESSNKQKIENLNNSNNIDKCSRFYLRSSIMQKYGKMTYNSVVPMTKSNLYLENEMCKTDNIDTKSTKDGFEVYSSAKYCNKNFEFYEMQHSNIIQRIDSSSCINKSPIFCDEIPKYKQCNLNHPLCNRTKNGKGKFLRHASESSFSSEKSDLSLRDRFETSADANKIIKFKNKNISQISCNDKQSKKNTYLPLFLTESDHVQFPSEAETAPQTPQGEMFFGEENSSVSCHWVAPDDFHVKAYSLVKQDISENFKCNNMNCENLNYSFLHEEKSEINNLPSYPLNTNNSKANSSSIGNKTRKICRKSQIELLHESLKEIKWAKDLNPECMLTKERKHQSGKLQKFTSEKPNKNSELSKKQISRQSTQIAKLNHVTKNELNNLSTNKANNCKRQNSSERKIQDCKYRFTSPQNKNFKYNILNHKEYIKKCSKKAKKQIIKNHLSAKSVNKNAKLNSQATNKSTSKSVKNSSYQTTAAATKKSSEIKAHSRIKHSKHKKMITSQNSKKADIQIKAKNLTLQNESSNEVIEQCPELRVSLEPLEETCLWEAKRKQCRAPSESCKLISLKDEQKNILHNLKTTWNILTTQQQQVFSSSIRHNLFSSFYNNQESRIAMPMLRTSKRRRYDEETVRYSVRQSECAFRYKEIAVKKHQNFIQIILVPNRSRHNSLTVEGMKEMKEALLSASKDTSCRAVLFNSSGSIFCSGIDLAPLLGSGKKQIADDIANAIKDLIQVMGAFPKPLVAAVNGGTVGLGVTLLTFCDVVLASDKATFFMPYAKLGYIAEGAATLTLPQVIGATMATDLLLRGRKLTAQQALQCGLVSEVLWPTQLMEEAIPRMHALAKQSLSVMEATKSMIRCHLWEKLQSTLENESRSLPKQWMSATCQQAIKNAIESGILTE